MIESITTSQRKLIASLRQARHRREERLFVAEGSKCVAEMARLFPCSMIVGTSAWLDENATAYRGMSLAKATRTDMERMSSLATAPEVMGVFKMPQWELDVDRLTDRLTVALDGVQDPGNLGTIIRCCDWYGIDTVMCSKDTVDVFNPKVIQSTMGALARVKVCYVDLPTVIKQAQVDCYGTFLDGSNIYRTELGRTGIIIMGNEGQGIRPEVAALVNRRLYIPPYPADAPHIDSLNVSMATAITLSEFRRGEG